MAKAKGSWSTTETIEATPKKTRQGRGQHTKYSATARNKAKKRYRGQGR
mgnify:CR=1 FL=1|tara:strand:- start:3 stop:149 length:147 start_codon:yes stop_codon:yes gene_type:complete